MSESQTADSGIVLVDFLRGRRSAASVGKRGFVLQGRADISATVLPSSLTRINHPPDFADLRMAKPFLKDFFARFPDLSSRSRDSFL
jgi:hypothetical protein